MLKRYARISIHVDFGAKRDRQLFLFKPTLLQNDDLLLCFMNRKELNKDVARPRSLRPLDSIGHPSHVLQQCGTLAGRCGNWEQDSFNSRVGPSKSLNTGTWTADSLLFSGNAFSCANSLDLDISIFNQSKSHALTEPEPEDFVCEIAYKRPRSISLYDIYVLILVIHAEAALALNDFDSLVTTFRQRMYGLEVRLLSSRDPGQQGYQVKTAMWSLRSIACWMHLPENHFKELTFVSRYKTGPELGYGQLVSLPAPPENGYSANTSDSAMSPPLAQLQRKSANIEDKITITNIEVEQTGVVFPPFEIYNCFINILVREAELDPDGVKFGILAYNSHVDFSFAMFPTSEASSDKFPNKFMIAAIKDLSVKLHLVRPTNLQWKPFTFRVRNNGAFIGKGLLQPGSFGPGLKGVWTNATDVEPMVVS